MGFEIIDITACTYNSFAITSQNDVFGFGSNKLNSLGIENNGLKVFTPQIIKNGSSLNITKVSCFASSTLFLTNDSRVFVVGSNSVYFIF